MDVGKWAVASWVFHDHLTHLFQLSADVIGNPGRHVDDVGVDTVDPRSRNGFKDAHGVVEYIYDGLDDGATDLSSSRSPECHVGFIVLKYHGGSHLGKPALPWSDRVGVSWEGSALLHGVVVYEAQSRRDDA